jgi:hypothetical protein
MIRARWLIALAIVASLLGSWWFTVGIEGTHFKSLSGANNSTRFDPDSGRVVTAPTPSLAVYLASNAVPDAQTRILFIGNSHTTFYEMPKIVGMMMEKLDASRKVYVEWRAVSHLDEAWASQDIRRDVESGRWNVVVLQAQKISMSGRFVYSTKEGVELAKLAKVSGAEVFFFAEWARKDVDGEWNRTKKIYSDMANEASAKLIPVGEGWERVHSAKPKMKLHDADGNHQNATGAFLTSCIIASQLADQDPTPLADFSMAIFRGVKQDQKKEFVEVAKSLLQESRTREADKQRDASNK